MVPVIEGPKISGGMDQAWILVVFKTVFEEGF